MFQPAVLEVIVLRLINPRMSLVLARPVAPEGKVRALPLTGAAPPQLAGVLQLLFAPPPVQVLVVCAGNEITRDSQTARRPACLGNSFSESRYRFDGEEH